MGMQVKGAFTAAWEAVAAQVYGHAVLAAAKVNIDDDDDAR